MELRQLRYFVTIANEGTYGRAAEALRVAQPALSRQIKKLEDELGASLFIRHSHGVSLTPEGETFHSRAEHILDEVVEITRTIRHEDATVTGCIRVGVSPGTAEILAFPLSQALARKHPGLRCEIVSMLMPTRTEMLRQGKVAFAVMNAPRDTEGLTLLPVMREPLCLIHRPDDTRFGQGPVQLDQLRGIPLVVGGAPESGVRALVDKAFVNIGMSVNVAAEVNTAGASKALVLEQVGPTVHVAAMARSELLRGDLVAKPIEGLFSTRVIALATDREPPRNVRIVLETVRACLSDLVASGRWQGARTIQ